ncbi:MAG: hypothetical protein N2578_01175 [Bdellovibrionaceae bacterium]|nr:hypothetical protein [Pseudobdellovibrionaceae bacterium]
MKKSEIPWTRGVLMICQKCSGRMSSAGASVSQKTPEELRDTLRSVLSSQGRKKDVRVMLSGCLSVCPKEEQALLWVGRDGNQEILLCAPEKTVEDCEGFLAEKIGS